MGIFTDEIALNSQPSQTRSNRKSYYQPFPYHRSAEWVG